ncbi:hypothetical protein BDV27DRAFT_64745 [Aspergillus caelatus]|uniref:Uncharacterized protein n=1 Tax=Aspergillus caelatus TaxID=61420 RepID=A0A5N7AD80_9EURO|nr:uncharacterized protein BDV27DRAFT_64745 [Aspergillus caelatus]KAE8367772.1 hypothetical protein BDV27DRAFT_64745 [Aspergillus caelatus]
MLQGMKHQRPFSSALYFACAVWHCVILHTLVSGLDPCYAQKSQKLHSSLLLKAGTKPWFQTPKKSLTILIQHK